MGAETQPEDSMDAAHYAERYTQLKHDIERCLSHREGWSGLPPLLDALHDARCRYRAARDAAPGGGDAFDAAPRVARDGATPR